MLKWCGRSKGMEFSLAASQLSGFDRPLCVFLLSATANEVLALILRGVFLVLLHEFLISVFFSCPPHGIELDGTRFLAKGKDDDS